MNTGTLIRFLGWATLTFSWLEANRLFFNAIANAINEHNEQIRLKMVENCFKLIAKDMCEDESDNKGEDESEVVVETVTETIREKRRRMI